MKWLWAMFIPGFDLELMMYWNKFVYYNPESPFYGNVNMGMTFHWYWFPLLAILAVRLAGWVNEVADGKGT